MSEVEEKTPLLSQDYNDDEDDVEEVEMGPISSTTRVINPDDDGEMESPPPGTPPDRRRNPPPGTPPRTRIQETSFGGRDYESVGARPKSQKTIVSERLKNKDESEDEIKSLFTNADTSQFFHWYDEYGELKVKLKRKGAKTYSLLKVGKLNDELPDTIIKALGVDYETILKERNNLLSQKEEDNKKIRNLENSLESLKKHFGKI